MNNNIYDPDIQDAPIHCVGFQIKNANQKEIFEVENVNGTLNFNITCVIYVPNHFREQQFAQSGRIFFSCLSNGMVVDQQIGEMPIQNSNTQDVLLYKYDVSFHIEQFDQDVLNFQAAWTNKHNGEMGLSESLRVGRFVNTFIPVVKRDGK